jgi:FkbH-like protein
MYETESNSKTESFSQVPADVLTAFGALNGRVTARTLLPWSEHCTECVWPTCYTTCDLYEPRKDGRCRRFVDGMVRIDYPEALNSYLLKIRFKRWGKLWAPANIRLFPAEKAVIAERRDYRIGAALNELPLPSALKRIATAKRYNFKKRLAQISDTAGELPTSFLIECFNPHQQPLALSLTMRSLNVHDKIPFQTLIHLGPGFRRVRIDISEISSVLDLRAPFSVEIIPNEVADGTTLYFGMMDFVRETPVADEKIKKVKCVVWDLDNTLWDGILVEDRAEKLRLKPGIREVIQKLDRRGILHSIASKNNFDEALDVLKRFRLDEYFLHPQISWQPKSEGLRTIASRLNVGIDTLLFVDDSEFELQEVSAQCPEVRTLRAEHYLELTDMEECLVPVTAEATERRKLYRTEATRQAAAENFGQDYFTFLKHCDIRLNIRPLTAENLDRVHELAQRTNQMNFSGNRYDRDALRQILLTPYLDTYVMDCSDRFGSYGVVGFSIIDRREVRMTDLMFSCRIQSKRVEHAFLAYVIRRYAHKSGTDMRVNYRKTPRNAPFGRVFTDLGLDQTCASDGLILFISRANRTAPDEGIVHINVQEDVPAAS